MPLISNYLTRARLSLLRCHLGREVCDVGCGYGSLIDYLPGSVERLVLLDRSPMRRQAVEARLVACKVSGQFIQADIEQESFELGSPPVQSAVMAALLEHLKFPETALKNVYRILRPGGTVVITTPSRLGGTIHSALSWLGLTHREAAREHERFYNRQSLTELLIAAGFDLRHYQRFQMGLNQLAVGRKPSSSMGT